MNNKILMQTGIGIVILGFFYFLAVQPNIQYNQISKIEQKATEFIEAPDKLKVTESTLKETREELSSSNKELQRINQELQRKKEILELATQKLQKIAEINQKVEDMVSQAERIDNLSLSLDGMTRSLEFQREEIRKAIKERTDSWWDRVKTVFVGFDDIDKKLDVLSNQFNEFKGMLSDTKEKMEEFKEVSEGIYSEIQSLQEGVENEYR